MTRNKLRISVISDKNSWINVYLPTLVKAFKKRGHQVRWIHDAKGIQTGDLAFYLSYGSIVKEDVLARSRNNLVVHESDLPKGRGWSPVTWQVLEGARRIPMVLFEAVDRVDAGVVYLKDQMVLKGNELVEDIRAQQAQKTQTLCLQFVDRYPSILSRGKVQRGQASYYARRTPKHSRLDPYKPLHQQFNLLRVVDNERYPAYFNLKGATYTLKIEKQRIERS